MCNMCVCDIPNVTSVCDMSNMCGHAIWNGAASKTGVQALPVEEDALQGTSHAGTGHTATCQPQENTVWVLEQSGADQQRSTRRFALRSCLKCVPPPPLLGRCGVWYRALDTF